MPPAWYKDERKLEGKRKIFTCTYYLYCHNLYSVPLWPCPFSAFFLCVQPCKISSARSVFSKKKTSFFPNHGICKCNPFGGIIFMRHDWLVNLLPYCAAGKFCFKFSHDNETAANGNRQSVLLL